MIPNLTIRQLIKNDIEAFFNLRLESLQKNPATFLSSYEEEKTSGRTFFENLLSLAEIENVIFGVFTEENLVGIIGIFQESATKARHKSNIWGMYVQPDYRHQGIGKLLMEAAINHAKEKMGCSIINLTVEATNLFAKKLYDSLGFQVWGTEHKAIHVNNKFYDECHMALII